jgi:serine/threonine protein kinase
LVHFLGFTPHIKHLPTLSARSRFGLSNDNVFFFPKDDIYLYLVMEYLPGGDLMTILMKYDILTEEQTRFFIAETALAVKSVHDLNYVHRFAL